MELAIGHRRMLCFACHAPGWCTADPSPTLPVSPTVAAMMAEEMHRFRCEEAVGGGLAEVVGALAAAGASPECGAVQDMQCRMEE